MFANVLVSIVPRICVLTLILHYPLTLGQFQSPSDENLYKFPQEGAYTYIAYMSSKAGFCTGTIINNYWILSAAHCFYFKRKVIGHRDVRITTGVADYEWPETLVKKETVSEEIRIHPDFWEMRLSKFDVALVKVRDKMDFDVWVGNISVAGDEWPQNGTEDCFALGYGGFRSTSPPTTILKLRPNVRASHGENACPCAKRFQWKRLVCVREDKHSLMCHGDDGGPLVCGKVVRAIAHMVSNRLTCDDPIYPTLKCSGGPERAISMYTFLCPLNDWLHSVVPDIPPKPPSCDSSILINSSTSVIAAFILQFCIF